MMNIMYIILIIFIVSVDTHDKFSHVESGQAAQQAGQWLDVEARWVGLLLAVLVSWRSNNTTTALCL